MILVKVKDVINKKIATNPTGGEKVFDLIKHTIDKGDCVTLSFDGIELMTTAFLNTALGKLYEIFDETIIKEKLIIVGIDDDDKHIVDRVVKVAKGYYHK